MLKRGKHDLYVDRKLEPYEKEDSRFHAGLSGKAAKLLKDAELEGDEYRKKLDEDEGDISIIVEAGDELGQVRIAVQYEGEKQKNDKCLSRQGDLIADVSAWLQTIYSEFQGDFEMEMVSHLCPRGDTRLLRLNPAEVHPLIDLKNLVQVKSKRKIGK